MSYHRLMANMIVSPLPQIIRPWWCPCSGKAEVVWVTCSKLEQQWTGSTWGPCASGLGQLCGYLMDMCDIGQAHCMFSYSEKVVWMEKDGGCCEVLPRHMSPWVSDISWLRSMWAFRSHLWCWCSVSVWYDSGYKLYFQMPSLPNRPSLLFVSPLCCDVSTSCWGRNLHSCSSQ